MTIASTTNRISYTGNGAVDTYAYTFKIFDEDDLLVTVKDTATPPVETTLTITTDYTVTGVGETSGGNVVLVNSSQGWLDGDGDLKSSYELTIRRVVDLLQNTDIRNQGSFFPETHEDEFDLLVMADQQQQDELDRTMKLPETLTSSDFDPTLPTDIQTADGALIVNSAGNAFEIDTSIGNGSKQVSVSSNDASKGYLNGKLVAGTNITFTENNDGSTETLSIGLTTPTISPVLTTPQINDTSADHQYVYAVNELAADRTVTLPLLTGNDEFVFKDHAVTMANKTLTSPVLNTGVSGTAVLDEDDLTSDSDTQLATQQSIKAYADTKQTLDATLTALAAYNTNGLVTQTAADTFAGRTLTGTADEIAVADGDGVSGNPTIGIADDPVLPGTGAVQVPSGTQAQRPGSPTNGDFRYNTDVNKFEGYQNSAWGELGGGGSGINFLEGDNSNAEGGIGDWVEFDDSSAYVDGTGGTASNLTLSQNTSTPLIDDADFSLAKGAADAQYEGISCDFTIDRAFLASVLRIEFYYDASDAAYADDDLRLMIYDKDDTNIIEPVGIDIKAGKGVQVAYFQTHPTSNDYRLSIFCNSSNASAYTVYFDNFRVGPATRTFSTPTSDWTSYTPGATWSTNTTVTGFWRRVGDSMEIAIDVSTSGAPDSANLEVDLPSGYTMDTTKLPNATINEGSLGSVHILDVGTRLYIGGVTYSDSNTLKIVQSESGNAGVVNQATPFTFASGDSVGIKASVPISGWGSQVQSGDGSDTRIIAARYSTSAGQSISASTLTKVDFGTQSFDTHSAVTTGAGWVFTAPSSGKYRVEALISWVGNSNWGVTEQSEFHIYKNGSSHSNNTYEYPTDDADPRDFSQSVSDLLDLNSGDTVSFRINHGSGGARSLTSTATKNYCIIQKISGPSAIAANELVAAKYETNAGQSMSSGATAIVDYEDIVYDTHSAVTTGASWKFTAPVAGKYLVSAAFEFDPASWGTGLLHTWSIHKNGTLENRLSVQESQTTSTVIFSGGGTVAIDLSKGDYIDARLFHNQGGAVTLDTAPERTFISIHRIGF